MEEYPFILVASTQTTMKKQILSTCRAICLTLLMAGASATLSGQSWTQRGSDIDGEAQSDESGGRVALSSDGKTLAIGAARNDGTANNAGHVRVYVWNSGTSAWVQRGSDIDGEAEYDFSGRSVALSSDGNTVAIGATSNDGTADAAGHVRVYDWNSVSSAWVKRGNDIDGEAENDRSGASVALSSDGNTVAIGAYGNSDNGLISNGHVRVYVWNSDSSAWVQRGSDIDGEATGDNSGTSVALSSDGKTVAIGAHRNDGTAADAGHVRVYDWNSGSSAWVQRGSDIDGEAEYDESGRSVALSSDGNTVAIDATLNDGTAYSAGHVRVYDWNSVSSAWVQRGSDIDGEAGSDYSGRSVALSSDGNTVAIGAEGNDGTADDAGHVRVYVWNSGTSAWVQRGSDIDGEAEDDESGIAVALSSDGNTVAIGAYYNAGTASDAGHVRVYTYSSSSTTSFNWDGGGSDERFFTKENWVGDLCPSAGADLVFNGTGSNTKHCILDSSLTLGTITLNNTYKGRFRVEKKGVVLTADSIYSDGPTCAFSSETGKSVIGYVYVGFNAFFSAGSNAGMEVKTLHIGLAGYASFRSRAAVFIESFTQDQYSQFKGPEDGNVYITGNMKVARMNTFDGRRAILHFTGAGNQELDVFGVNQLKTTPIVVNKSSGSVVLKRDLNSDKLTLTSGNITTGSNKLTLTAPGGLTGGSSSSYINGKVFVDHSSAWTGSKFFVPLGKGSKYRPITLHNASSTNTWELEFMDSDPNSLGSANAPLTDISADGYWSANRTAGGGGLAADATYFEISDAGKGAWSNGDLRVAHFDGSTGWDDRGGSFTTNAVISSDNTLHGNAGYLLALGNDNGVPAPHVLVAGDVVSGKELRTTATSSTTQASATRMLSFNVFPNPVAETLNINLSGADKGSITLSDLSGKVLGVYSADTRSIDMRNYAAGVYFATFSNGSQRIAQRVIRN
jgi:hypothetical protein